MTSERREKTFQQLLDEGLLEIGDGYRAQNNELGGIGPIFLRAGHVTDSHIDFTGVEHFHERLAEKVRSKMSKVGDTIITTKGNSTGRTSFVTERLPPFVYSPHLSYWRSRDPKKLCGGFLRYWSQSVEFIEQLSGMKASTDMAPYLSLTDQRRLSITLPPLAEQKAIAAVLGALDDKIELNRRMNATLEAMARALFQSWFVDFDPVRQNLDAKPCLAGRQAAPCPIPEAERGTWFTYAIECQGGSLYIGQTDNLRRRWKHHVDGKGAEWTKTHAPVALVYWETHDSLEAAVEREAKLKSGSGREWLKQKIAEGLSAVAGTSVRPPCLTGRQAAALHPATAALFPDSFQDSEAGHIPKGWTPHRLPDAIELNPRRTLKSGTIAPYLDMKNLPTQGHSADQVIDREFRSGTKFQNGDTLLARITPCLENGKTGYVDFLEDGQVGWGSTEYIVLTPRPPLPPQFGYLLARSDALRTHAIQNMTGTSGRQRVPVECFHNFWLAVPPPEIARRFDELTAPLMAKIKANSTESRTLGTLRDTLLPKLLSGELSMAEMEREVSA